MALGWVLGTWIMEWFSGWCGAGVPQEDASFEYARPAPAATAGQRYDVTIPLAGIQIAAVTLAQSAPVTLFGSKSCFVRH
jgi:hypothetical protein